MHYIYSIFSYFFVSFAFLTLYNFSSSSTIVFLVQSFIPTNIYINFHLIPLRFLNIFLYIFLNSTVSICSTFHLLPPFLFHFNFHINLFLASLFPIPSKLSTTKMSVLYLFLQFCFSFGGFFFFIVPTTFLFLLMVLFVIVDLIVTSHLLIFLVNSYKFLSISMHI